MRVLSARYIAAVLVLLGIANLARAAIIAPPAPDFKIMMQVVGSTGSYPIVPDSVTPIPNGDKWKYQVDGHYVQHGYDMTLSFTIDPDPTITGNVAITNVTAAPQDYLFTFNLPVSPGFNPSQLNGSVGVTATADSTAGAVATTSPDPLYTALIDNVGVKTLLNNPFSLPVAAFDSNVTTAKFGLPVPDAGGAVNSSIGIKLHFNVTPGDQAGVTSQFTANPVPEPTALLGLAIAGVALVRRRK